MLELKSVSWQNFLSYGDYETKIELDNLGQCLITGEVIDEDTREAFSDSGTGIRKSNGAGKSTAPNAIQWCLFGRTMHSHNPGNKVVNYFTGKDCVVTVEFKNGDKITRTRNTDGCNELFFIKNGNEHKLESDTLSTAKNQQTKLAKEFNLDWDVFCGSVFFNQYGKPWMEMADQTRKKAIERILHIDKFIYYAKVAKEKSALFDSKVEKNRNKVETLRGNIKYYEQQIERLTEASKNFYSRQKERQKELLQEAINEKSRRDSLDLPDVDKLKSSWEVVDKIRDHIGGLRSKSNNISSNISRTKGDIRSIESRIATWEEKSGEICIECEQNVPESYVGSKINPLQDELDGLKKQLGELNESKSKIDSMIEAAESKLEQRMPSMSVADAKSIHKQWERHDKAIDRNKSEAKRISTESNPHDSSIEETKRELDNANAQISKLEKEIEKDDFMGKHYYYIYKAYNDRTKIKSYVFQDHIPFINNRLKHYLDVFDLDVKIELTKSLGITSNMWGYDFESGGERKRTDVAFMLAMFDFHETMYGRQCNTLVLDEVDGRLDDDGVDALINIIKNDIAPKVETVLIISHKTHMFDVFPNEIKVVRTDRFSQLINA